jgi:LemA protein
LIFTYNNLNAKKKRVERSFSTIDVYLEKRFDEVGALLEQAEEAYKHESDIQTQVSALRSGIATAKAGSINDKISLANNFSRMSTIAGLRGEMYPELQAILNQGMFVMQKTSAVEDDLASARKQYNNNATSYNTAISSFPNVLVVGIFGFKTPFELFKVTEGKKERPVSNVVANRNKKEDLATELEMEKMKLQAEIDKKQMLEKAGMLSDDNHKKDDNHS